MPVDHPAIETHGLTRYYGRTVGIDDLDLTVERGEVFGFLGPNGSGKTTTIRLLLDFMRPTRGSAALFGVSTRAPAVRARRRSRFSTRCCRPRSAPRPAVATSSASDSNSRHGIWAVACASTRAG
jgi:ABC-type transporter Mla maintaining outer membrane lipid asymmetry ATPase subunit MlaF